jgi:hypothetical protein
MLFEFPYKFVKIKSVSQVPVKQPSPMQSFRLASHMKLVAVAALECFKVVAARRPKNRNKSTMTGLGADVVTTLNMDTDSPGK